MTNDIPIELYGARTGNCLRVSIALEEAALPYVVRRVDLRRGEQRRPQHLVLNPMGQVPTVVVNETRGEPPFVLSQLNAILFYVAERVPGRLFSDVAPELRVRTYERIFFFLTAVIAPSHSAFVLRSIAPGNQSKLFDQRSVAALVRAEAFLADSRYMAGESFTLADIAAFTITIAHRARTEWGHLPGLRQWFEDVQARPTVNRGLRAFDVPAAN
jgi:GST-like protein